MDDPDRAEQRRLSARLLRNVGHLAGGSFTAVAVGLVTLGATAQMLGPALLGIFAMVEAYGKLFDQVLRLETWQCVIKYGARALEDKQRHAFARLIKLGVVIDLASAGLAAATAFLAAPLIGALVGWDARTIAMAQIYGLSLLVGVSSTATGVLRLFDRFAQIAWLTPALAVARLVCVLVIWKLGGSIWPFLLAMIGLQVTERLALTAMACRELRRHGHLADTFRAPLRGSRSFFPGVAGFIAAANGTVLIRTSTREFDVLVVGAYTGAIGAGIYHIARKFTLAAIKAGGLIQQAAFPDLARLWARGDMRRFKGTIARIELATVAFAALAIVTLIVAGERIIRLVAGEDFTDAITPLTVHAVAGLLFLAGSAMRPAVMATGHQTQMLYITAASAMAFYATLFLAVPQFGVVGGSIAHVVFSAIWLPAAALLFASVMRRASPPSPAPPQIPD